MRLVSKGVVRIRPDEELTLRQIPKSSVSIDSLPMRWSIAPVSKVEIVKQSNAMENSPAERLYDLIDPKFSTEIHSQKCTEVKYNK
jgi:hypothetical protein